MTDKYDRRSSMNSGLDDPPNSRLFIIGSKLLCEDDFRKAFQEFGSIEEIWTVRDRQTGESKGKELNMYSNVGVGKKLIWLCTSFDCNLCKIPMRAFFPNTLKKNRILYYLFEF
jgi:hypothetical protein